MSRRDMQSTPDPISRDKNSFGGKASNFLQMHLLKENYSSRCLAAVVGDKNHNRFLVGTNSLKMKNEIYLFNYAPQWERNEFENKIILEGLFAHDEEITNLSSCPSDPNQLVTSYPTGTGEYGASLFDLGILTQEIVSQEDEGEGKHLSEHKDLDKSLKLNKIVDFGLMDTPVNSILWDDELVCEAYGKKAPEEIILCDSEAMRVFDLNRGKMTDCIKVVKNSGYEDTELAKAKRVTHNQKLIANAIDNHIVCWDTREFSGKPAYKIENAHLAPILDIDFNPNKPYACCTGGEDLNIRFWDIRKNNGYLCSFEEDSHWVLSVKYNRYYDQLVLTSSSSTYVSLWRAVSCSSINTPITKTLSLYQDNTNKDALVETYEHEDTINSVEWSASEAWIFASISYNGAFFINTVPPEEKFSYY